MSDDNRSWPERLVQLNDDELEVLRDEIARVLERRRAGRRGRAERCQLCNGTGKLEDRYCGCQLGKDLWRIEVGRGPAY